MLTMFVVFVANSYAQSNEELKEQLNELKDQLTGIDERLLTMESDVAKLKSIKISGYVQAQFEKYEANVNPKSTFFMRRVRVKTTYEAYDGVKFVVQPDFVVNAVTLKDAYVVVNEPWLKTFSLNMRILYYGFQQHSINILRDIIVILTNDQNELNLYAFIFSNLSQCNARYQINKYKYFDN